MDKLVDNDIFSGAVLIAKDGNILFEKAYGMANKTENQSNHVDTKFNLGSANKMFTAVAIAQLAEQGKLSFGDTIGKYVGGFPADIGEKVTIEQLLTHTSGMGDFMGPDYFAKADEVDTVDGFMAFVVNRPLRFEPGTKHEYSNAGFVVLGAVIEKVSGESYYDYIRDHIAKPAGMSNTDFYAKTAHTPDLSHGYLSAAGGLLPQPQGGGKLHTMDKPPAPSAGSVEWIDNMDKLPIKGNPSGGGYSTVGDMLKFADALLGYKLLGKQTTDLITTGQVDTPIGEYGYGFEELIDRGHRTVGHSGGSPGVNAIFRMFTDNGYTVIVLSNYDEAARAPYEEFVRLMLAP